MNFSNMFKGFSDLFSVDSPVSSSSFDMSDDVIKTQNALSDLGHFNTQTPDIGAGLKSFQADNGLKADGIMNPGGPTENALSQTLAGQGIGNTDLLEKSNSPLPSNIEVSQPISSKADNKSWTASAPFGETPKPKAPSKPKANMKKAWDDFYIQQSKKAKTAIVPQGNTVDERIRSMMQDNRYQDKRDTGLRDHVVKQFERAYPGMVEYDETGKMVQAKPIISPDEVEPYDPHGELRYAQEQADQIQALSHQLPERDQTSSTGANDEGPGDYPHRSNTQSSARRSSDQLGPNIPFNEAALAEASAMSLDGASQGKGHQVAQNQYTDTMSDAGQADTPHKPLSKEAVEHLAKQYNDALASGDEKQIKGFQGALNAYHPDDRARIVDAYHQKFKSGDGPKLSDEATKEMGDHLARRKARDPYDEGRLDATDTAINTTYTKEEQERIRKHAEENPQPVMPKHHDVWRDNVHVMGEVMGLDKKLIDEAGNDAMNAMAAAMSYRQLKTPEAQRKALAEIQRLEEAGYRKLAFKLRGEVGVSLVQDALVPTSQSDKEIKQQIKDHKALEKAAGTISNLPGLPPTATIGAKTIEDGLQRKGIKDKRELKRRQRRH
ncbi:hypothetical protein RYZ26_15100 [Terasakiella sp. A23]|uniref:peptidoglycan-binding domain-containing protein n=1 Tax=Terasakiella sp. FCG-A23 TaxID=3080561 RepID=UPI002953AA04|nr:hypothetical protein [Terasakiella sp. A23]MDV7340933.1 hypothetical protein [Terasakiella sp. A23]